MRSTPCIPWRRGRRTAVLSFAVPAFVATCLAAVPAAAAPQDEPLKARCNTSVAGSTGTATCYNPNGYDDHVRLHIECRRWYDPDVDTRPVAVGPAQYVTLTGHCWQEIAELWVSHSPQG